MSPQVEFLKNLIASARTGEEVALKLLRDVCLAAVRAAPAHDLITIADCLFHIGLEATRTESQRN